MNLYRQTTHAFFFILAHFLQPIFSFAYDFIQNLSRLYVKKQITKQNIDPIAEYTEFQNNAFSKFHVLADVGNHNIDPAFRYKKDYQQMLADSNNACEKIWKTRILFENTPRGNIIMYYDVYKLGFVYFSDTQSIPYSILNAVAMKYVRVFHCLDFFMDNNNDFESPLIQIHLVEEKKADKKADMKTDNGEKGGKSKNFIPLDAPFAKLKNYSKTAIQKTAYDTTVSENASPEEKPKKTIYTNRFICLGKIYNFRLLQPTKPKAAIIFQTKLFSADRIHPTEQLVSNPLRDECSNEVKSVINYRNYKEFRNKTELQNKTADITPELDKKILHQDESFIYQVENDLLENQF